MVLGYFGKTPVTPDPEVIALSRKQLKLEPTKKTVVEINNEDHKKGINAAVKKLQSENLEETDENIFIVATCKV